MTNPKKLQVLTEQWACDACGQVYTYAGAAESCCSPCVDCGVAFRELIGGWSICPDCRTKRVAEREEKAREKARKVSYREWKLPVVGDSDGHGGETWCCDVDIWIDDLDCPGSPAWAWGAREVDLKLDAADLIDWLEPPPEMDLSELEESLQKLLDKWAEEHAGAWYIEDRSIIVEWPGEDG